MRTVSIVLLLTTLTLIYSFTEGPKADHTVTGEDDW